MYQSAQVALKYASVTESNYLTRNNLVKRHKRKGLCHHRTSEISLRQSDGYQDCADRQLRHERKRLEAPATGCRWRGGGEVKKRVIGREVMAVVNTREMMEVGMS